MKNPAFYLFGASAALNILSWIWVATAVPAAAFPVIVSFNIFWRQDVLGERSLLFTAPLLGAVMLALNAVLWTGLKRAGKDEFLGVLLAASTLGLEILVLAIVWFVVNVNT